MTTMRRTRWLFVVLGMALVLGACGGEAGGPSSSIPASSTSSPSTLPTSAVPAVLAVSEGVVRAEPAAAAPEEDL